MTEKNVESSVWLSPLTLEGEFHANFRDDHVHVEIGPNYTIEPEHQDKFWTKLKALCEEHGSKRVLVEGFAPSGERETAEIIDAGQRTATVPKMWLAFSLADFTPSERSELFVVIAATRGVRVKFFSDSQTALKWLRANAPA